MKLKQPTCTPNPTSQIMPKPNQQYHFTVLSDSAEGFRIPFGPSMRWNPRGLRHSVLITIGYKRVNLGRLSTSRGDITLDGYTHVVAVERKGKVSELLHNMNTGKLERQLTTLRRLVKHPYLLLDIPLPEIYGTGKNAIFAEDNPAPAILDRVLRLANRLDVSVIGPCTAKSGTARRALGEYLVRVMLSHIHNERYIPYDTVRLDPEAYAAANR